MPKIFDQYTLIIEAGAGVNVNWGPDFGDPADDTSWIARVGQPFIDAIALDGTQTVVGTLTLSSTITGDITITLPCIVRIENLDFKYTGPWTVTGDITYDEAITYDNLLVAGTITRDIAPLYSLIAAGDITTDIAIPYTGPWTARGSLNGALVINYEGPWILEGEVNFDLANVYNRTCQAAPRFDFAQLDHTKNCNCAYRISSGVIVFTEPWTALGTITFTPNPIYSLLTGRGTTFFDFAQLSHTKNCAGAPRISSLVTDIITPRTCQTSIAELVYQLDFVNAATGVDISVTVPPGATSMFSEVWSGGGGGGTANVNGGGGGGGGGFASDTEPVTAGTTIDVQIGAGGAISGNGGISRVREAGTTRCQANGGGGGGNGGVTSQGSAGLRGTGSSGDTQRDGGLGGGGGGVQTNGGGGGGAAGTNNAGGNGAANRTAGTGGAQLGGDGGIGGGLNAASATGNQRGGGGGGASATNAASTGARGGVRVQFTIPTP